MKEKLKKIVYEYDLDSRVKTKDLGKKTKTSQQSAFYLINTLKEKGIILGETCIVDPLKLGYINTLVGYNFLLIDEKTRKKVISYLCNIKEIINVEESKEGFDLLVEYSTKNLGKFDQIHRKIVNTLKKDITTFFIFPIISKFIYPKKYLKDEKQIKQSVLFGDREYKQLSKQEKSVLNLLVKDPTSKIIDISELTGINIKSVTKIKKDLENKKIIKGYGAIFDHIKLGIKREIMFLRFTSEGLQEIQKFIEYSRENKNIIEAIKVIGSSQIVIVIEGLKEIEIIREIRSNFSIQNYMVFRSEKIFKKSYLPIKD